MAKYRKKPVVIEAVQITRDNIHTVESWCKGSIKGIKLPLSQRCIDIQTMEGEMRANMGDWIIKEPYDLERGFYPCKPDIFELTYEKVED